MPCTSLEREVDDLSPERCEVCEAAEIAEGGGRREQGEEHAVEILRCKS